MVAWGKEHMKRTEDTTKLRRGFAGRVRVLGIETSCDETAAAIVDVRGQVSGVRGQVSFDVQSNVVASQVRTHAKYGGIVPEVAAREHVAAMLPVVQAACAEIRNPPPKADPPLAEKSEIRKRPWDGTRYQDSFDAIAVTTGPGLITSLTVGAETARTLAYAWEKPLIAVNHIEGHVMSALLPNPPLRVRGGQGELRVARNPSHPPLTLRGGDSSLSFPALALIVSGGHTELLLMRGWGKYECIGATRDDAAGEAFDKVGKLLGLGYPGGPAVARAAERGNPTAFDFPRPMMDSGDFGFSFSGLKTAVRYLVEKQESRIKNKGSVGDVCASFQAAVVDVLAAKTIAAAEHYHAKTVLLGGGVAANRLLREQLGTAIHKRLPLTSYLLPLLLATTPR